MSGMFDFMQRMIAGKPVFENKTDADQLRQEAHDETQPVETSKLDKANEHTFPVVFVKHATTHEDGNNIQVYCQIVNTWPEEVMLDKIRLFGMTRELDHFMRAGEEREFLVYSGPKLQKEYFEAFLDYKTKKEADYFEAIHDVKFTYQPDDKTYVVDEFRLRHPIRDIYG